LLVARLHVANDEAIFISMQSLLFSYNTSIHFLRRQQGIAQKLLMIDLIQDESLMKDMNLTLENTSVFYIGKKYF